MRLFEGVMYMINLSWEGIFLDYKCYISLSESLLINQFYETWKMVVKPYVLSLFTLNLSYRWQVNSFLC
jgi:hypothetical protein